MPDGRGLKTLRDAGHYITARSGAAQRKPKCELATGFLLTAAENGGTSYGAVFLGPLKVAQTPPLF